MNKPKIFVSSTCYDLNQVRLDISNFIDKVGYHPMLSNSDDFPINPNKETIENCIDAVNKNADILVLIIGNRYGYITENGLSITNLEYLNAKLKNIPIYVFIKKETLSYYNVWKANKNNSFEGIVDSKELFRFIEDIRDKEQTWCFEFESSSDITSTLRSQFAKLFNDGLEQRKIIMKNNLPKYWKNISSEAINIIIKKETLYELRFFNQVNLDEYYLIENLYYEYRNGFLFKGSSVVKDADELKIWLKQQLVTLNSLPLNIDKIVNELFPKFYGEAGTPSDLEGLLFVAQTLRKQLEELILWSIEVKSTIIYDESLNLLIKSLSGFTKNCIEEIWSFPFTIKKQIDESLNRILRGEKNINLNIRLDITLDKKVKETFLNELNKL